MFAPARCPWRPHRLRRFSCLTCVHVVMVNRRTEDGNVSITGRTGSCAAEGAARCIVERRRVPHAYFDIVLRLDWAARSMLPLFCQAPLRQVADMFSYI